MSYCSKICCFCQTYSIHFKHFVHRRRSKLIGIEVFLKYAILGNVIFFDRKVLVLSCFRFDFPTLTNIENLQNTCSHKGFPKNRPFWEFFFILIEVGNEKTRCPTFSEKVWNQEKVLIKENFKKEAQILLELNFFRWKALVFSLGSPFTAFLLREARKISHFLKSRKSGNQLWWKVGNRQNTLSHPWQFGPKKRW